MHNGSGNIKNPGPFVVSGMLRGVFVILLVAGLFAFGSGLMVEPKRAWFAFVLNHFFFMTLAIGGIFFAAIQWVTSAMWSAPVRRVAESFTAYIPVALVSFLVMAIFGMKYLYIWTDPAHVQGDLVLEHKSGYLSIGFFIVRNLVFIGVMWFFARKMVRNSLLQDTERTAALTERNKSLSPLFLILFALLYTMGSFDQLMSLDPHWFSTMFGVYTFAGLFYSVLAAIAIVSILLKRAGPLQGIVNENHIHDLGKFMFAFTVFWAYIGFSQFMLIWYANLPEETGYFIHRMHGGWFAVSVFLLLGKFGAPFFFLLPRDKKRSDLWVVLIALWMLFAQWVDLLWITQPEYATEGPKIGFIELGTPLAFLGLFGLAVTWFLSKNSVVAIGDPRLEEAVFHHHQ